MFDGTQYDVLTAIPDFYSQETRALKILSSAYKGVWGLSAVTPTGTVVDRPLCGEGDIFPFNNVGGSAWSAAPKWQAPPCAPETAERLPSALGQARAKVASNMSVKEMCQCGGLTEPGTWPRSVFVVEGTQCGAVASMSVEVASGCCLQVRGGLARREWSPATHSCVF